MPRTLTAAELLSLSELDLRNPIDAGKLLYLLRQSEPMTPQRRMLERLYETSKRVGKHDVLPSLTDPTRTPRRVHSPGPLSAADIAWIERLPTDPAAVSDDDLRTLAGMRKATEDQRDRRLLDSVIQPAREAWMARATKAHAEAVKARTPVRITDQERHQVHEDLRQLVADTIAAEVPELNRGEALERATVQINATAERVKAARRAELAAADAAANPAAGADAA